MTDSSCHSEPHHSRASTQSLLGTSRVEVRERVSSLGADGYLSHFWRIVSQHLLPTPMGFLKDYGVPSLVARDAHNCATH